MSFNLFVGKNVSGLCYEESGEEMLKKQPDEDHDNMILDRM